MEITVRDIGREYKEVIIEQLGMNMESGTLNRDEQIELAKTFLYVAEELLNNIEDEKAKIIYDIAQGL